jgi:cytochrome c oxidase subunit 4
MVFAALVVLTVLTVTFHQMHLGALAAPVAFLIATAKATLVLAYFMHLKYDNKLNRVMFLSSFFFLFLLFLFSALDLFLRAPVLESM